MNKFREQWVRQGFEGGKKAAQALREAIAEQCGDRADDIEIVCKVVANRAGLGKTLSRAGGPESCADIRGFAAGFTNAYASFDFVDVGTTPGAASSKLKGMLAAIAERRESALYADTFRYRPPADNTRWHLQNQNCKHILLGISHDPSYAPFVSEILEDETTRECITVIEGVPVAHELASTEVKVMDLGKNIFRCETPNGSAYSAWANGGPRTASPATSVGSSNLTPGSSIMSYANVTSSGSPPPQINVAIAPRPFSAVTRPKVQYQQIPPQQPDWNPGARGLDEPITVSVTALENIKKRKDHDKLCNNHFLRGPCTKGDSCMFVHNYKPTTDEINAIAVLARQNPCTSGQDCELEDCIYGHHVSGRRVSNLRAMLMTGRQCPSMKDGVCCHPFCKFAEDAHPPGTKYRNSHIRANN